MNHSLTEKAGNSKKQLIIGLDFGATFSKVVISDKRVRYAVPFGEFASPDKQYLLPSILSIDENNRCCLTSADATANTTTNLKISLLNETCSDEDLLPVAAYLALVFRTAQSWLLDRYKNRYGGRELSWSINAGLSVDDAMPVKLADRYQQVLLCAWNIGVLPGSITLNRVRQFMGIKTTTFDAFPAVYKSKIINIQSITIFPDSYAQICAYVHSKKCQDELHMLIDVGASNITVATFMVEHAEDDSSERKCRLYACAVEPIGVRYFLKRRYENLQLADGEINLFKNTPDSRAFAQAHDLTEKDIQFADTLYSGDVAKLINKIMALTKNNDCANSARWESGVLTLCCGGGAHLEIVQNIMHRLENKSPPQRIKLITQNPPDDLVTENLPADSYGRLTVAYGLSFEAAAIAAVAVNEFIIDAEKTAEA